MDKKVLDYRVVIEREKYPNGKGIYVAYCPTLGISDYGDTVEDVLVSIKDGIELALEHLAKERKELPFDQLEEQIITSTKVSVPSGFAVC